LRILVTGAAGFIGFHTSRALLARGDAVTGLDNVNDYYDVRLKEARLAELDRAATETSHVLQYQNHFLRPHHYLVESYPADTSTHRQE
jgi:UDP-glucuronate 4-epimerase